MAELYKSVDVKVTDKSGILNLSITAGLRQYVICRADYRYENSPGIKSGWMPIDHFNRLTGDIGKAWPVSDCSKLQGAEICVQFVVGRLSPNPDKFRLKAALSVGGVSISGGEASFEEDLTANAISRDIWFYLT